MQGGGGGEEIRDGCAGHGEEATLRYKILVAWGVPAVPPGILPGAETTVFSAAPAYAPADASANALPLGGTIPWAELCISKAIRVDAAALRSI